MASTDRKLPVTTGTEPAPRSAKALQTAAANNTYKYL